METVKRVEQTTEKEQTEDRLVVEEEEVEIEVEVWNSMQTANRVGQMTEKEETGDDQSTKPMGLGTHCLTGARIITYAGSCSLALFCVSDPRWLSAWRHSPKSSGRLAIENGEMN